MPKYAGLLEDRLPQDRHQEDIAKQINTQFLTKLSHAIKTSMNSVIGMAELLTQSKLDSRQQTFVEIILKSGNGLLALINDVLEFSRIEAGMVALKSAPFSLTAAIEDETALIIPRIREKNLELIMRMQPGLGDHYIGDAGHLRKIIAILLGNAVNFTDSGHVLIDIGGEEQEQDTLLHVAVSDSGPGIASSRLAHIFNQFSQPYEISSQNHEGMGLGLAIAARLVSLMGATLNVTSQKNQGTTFSFNLKLRRAETMVETPVIADTISGARILIVDDNIASRAFLLELVKSWGVDACAAENSEEGLAVLRAMAALGLRPDCIILDYQMPEMNGVQMARIIHETPQIASAPIILLSTVELSSNLPDHEDHAISHHLAKPVRPMTLMEAVRAAIRQNREGVAPSRSPMVPAGAGIAAQNLRLARKDDAKSHRVDVLVAEDNAVNQLFFTQILIQTGLTYQIVANGRLAVQACRAIRPRMVLMDMSMPQMNGLEATAQIRKAEAGTGQRIPIIGVCAHALKGDPERFFAAGMDDYLTKPISPQMLTQMIERWLSSADEAHQPSKAAQNKSRNKAHGKS